jgi:hypothetical protein
MKKVRWIVFLALFLSAPLLFGSSVPQSALQQGTVLAIHKQEIENPPYSGGDNPSDAPLRSEFYAYTVKLQVDCSLYQAYYQSPYDYLSLQIAPDQQLPVRLAKHEVHFELAGGREVTMHLVGRKNASVPDCTPRLATTK